METSRKVASVIISKNWADINTSLFLIEQIKSENYEIYLSAHRPQRSLLDSLNNIVGDKITSIVPIDEQYPVAWSCSILVNAKVSGSEVACFMLLGKGRTEPKLSMACSFLNQIDIKVFAEICRQSVKFSVEPCSICKKQQKNHPLLYSQSNIYVMCDGFLYSS